jgi:hypothetical protein
METKTATPAKEITRNEIKPNSEQRRPGGESMGSEGIMRTESLRSDSRQSISPQLKQQIMDKLTNIIPNQTARMEFHKYAKRYLACKMQMLDCTLRGHYKEYAGLIPTCEHSWEAMQSIAKICGFEIENIFSANIAMILDILDEEPMPLGPTGLEGMDAIPTGEQARPGSADKIEGGLEHGQPQRTPETELEEAAHAGHAS